jgi:Tol biopolymer transport system component
MASRGGTAAGVYGVLRPITERFDATVERAGWDKIQGAERCAMGNDPPAALVRAELDRILASVIFARSERLSAFLRFIVEQTLDGQGDTLKEQIIATELYGKGPDFNTAADPIVRVDARRLRDRLREYYTSAPHSSLVITVPKGSYRPVFTIEGRSSTQVLPARARTFSVLGAALSFVAATAWVVGELRFRSASEPIRLLTVTSQPGAEEDPAISADGNAVVYAWHPETTANADLWLKTVDGEPARQLTNTPDVSEKWPQWSPDGQRIAYTSLVKGKPPSVFTVSPNGGSPRLIAERAAQGTWTPNGNAMVMVGLEEDRRSALVEYVLGTGARRTLIRAPAESSDIQPKVSPDGRRLAFVRDGSGRAAVFVMSMSGGDAIRLSDWSNGLLGGLAWTPDSKELLFPQPELSGRRVVRLHANGAGAAVGVLGIPREAAGLSISRVAGTRDYRLAFAAGQPDIGLRLIDLRPALIAETITAVAPFCDATRFDAPGRFSPDGSLVAFTSDRGGNQQVWVAGRDGASERSLTRLPDAVVNVGGWSPDGRWLAFDAVIGDKTAIYRVSLDGVLQQLTDDSATNGDAEWSRDGAWIYYASTASGRSEIWKMPAGGGPRVPLTSEGGFEPRLAADGKSVYFVDRPRVLPLLPGTLKRVSIDGGPSSMVHAGIPPGTWDVTDTGIVFVMHTGREGAASRARDVLAVLDPVEGRVRELGALPFSVAPYGATRRLMASRDGNWVIVSHIDRWERDVMVLDNFR